MTNLNLSYLPKSSNGGGGGTTTVDIVSTDESKIKVTKEDGGKFKIEPQFDLQNRVFLYEIADDVSGTNRRIVDRDFNVVPFLKLWELANSTNLSIISQFGHIKNLAYVRSDSERSYISFVHTRVVEGLIGSVETKIRMYGSITEEDNLKTHTLELLSPEKIDDSDYYEEMRSFYPSIYAMRDMAKDINATKKAIGDLEGISSKFGVYGVEWSINQANPDVTRIGNMECHRTLPVQSMMRGCILNDDGVVVKYLPEEMWSDEDTDGSKGQVMVELPEFWWKFETEGETLRVLMSLLPFDGAVKVPRRYVSAYEATVDRETNTLCSCMNFSEKYRGGNNTASWDGTYRSLLGMPATNISLTNYRAYAKKRGDQWSCMTYDVHKELYWLFVVEYATRNSQKDYVESLTEDGYKQGGLGAGVTDINSDKWNNLNSRNPFVNCGYSNSVGNGTSGDYGFNLTSEQEEYYGGKYNTNVIRYRGVENPFGHTAKWVDGLIVDVHSDSDGGTSDVYVCAEVKNYSSTLTESYIKIGEEKRSSGYSRRILFGDRGDIITTVSSGASSTTYYCDQSYASIPTTGSAVRAVCFGGSATLGAYAGLVFSNTSYAFSSASASIGSRLCFCPQN